MRRIAISTSAVLALVFLLSPIASRASASQLSLARAHERRIDRRILQVRRHVAHRHRDWRRRAQQDRPFASLIHHVRDARFEALIRRERGRSLRQNRAHLKWIHRADRRAHRSIDRLVHQRALVRAWIARWGIFSTCPVRGEHVVDDNFGVIVRIPGVPVHVHEGDDIQAPLGTPVVAPFDGTAVATPSKLGGIGVDVYGPKGYVYNAHLASYGRLGSVRAGDVIGYVGATGDAGGPHDHFEWHPWNGAAVDPHPYLSVVC